MDPAPPAPEPKRDAPLPSPRGVVRLAGTVALVLAAVHLAVLLFTAASRIGMPFDLEWMEGSMVDHAARVKDGLPLYCSPSLEHVPYLYTPLYFAAGAAVWPLVGSGLLALRLVQLLSCLGVAVLAWRGVRRETGSSAAGGLAAGVFLAGYLPSDGWYDLARNDGLFLLLAMGAAHALRWGGPWRGPLLAALLAVLSFTAKQSLVFLLPFLGAAALMLGWSRALRFTVAVSLGLGAVIGLGHWATDGWSTFYVFVMPSGHGTQPDRWVGFWTEDALPLWPAGLVAVVLGWTWLRGLRRSPASGTTGRPAWLPADGGGAASPAAGTGAGLGFQLAWIAGLLGSAYLSRLHAGGHVNALIPAYLAGGLVIGLGLARARAADHRGAGTLPAAAAAILAVVQLAVTLDDPRRQIPRPGTVAAWAEREASLRELPGTVFLPFTGDLAARIGKPRTAHAMAILDVLQYEDPDHPGERSAPWEALKASIFAAATSGEIRAVELNNSHAAVFLASFPFPKAGFTPVPYPVPDPRRMCPPAGMVTWPDRRLVR